MVVGLVDNFSLLYHYLFLYHTERRVRCTHLILKHLIISNFLVILSKGVSQKIVTFGLKHFSANLGTDFFHMFRE